VKQLKGFHQRAIVILEFSPDGTQLLSIGQDDQNTLAVYNWKNGKITWSSPTSKGKATGACWKNNK
jgi:microtubule-associated protein-like 6